MVNKQINCFNMSFISSIGKTLKASQKQICKFTNTKEFPQNDKLITANSDYFSGQKKIICSTPTQHEKFKSKSTRTFFWHFSSKVQISELIIYFSLISIIHFKLTISTGQQIKTIVDFAHGLLTAELCSNKSMLDLILLY